MTGLFELLTNKEWMVMPDYVQAIRGLLQHNLANHTPLDYEKTASQRALIAADGSIRDMVEASAADDEEYGGASEERKDQFVTVLYVDGPVTRNGDACSYGSRELRDILMQAADSDECLGHLFYINTPGGSAWAVNDFKQAIDYAHSKGQKVYAYIDGLCASAGMYLAALCDERYYCNPKDQVGCIGVMAAFYTEKDGSFCQFTNETYHEIYDPESFDKNKDFRDIANDGNDKLLVEDLARLGVEFRADVKKGCPNAKDEHLHGKLFYAEDVEGILVDGQRPFAEVVRHIAAAANQEREKKSSLTPNKNNISMKEKFPALFALLGVEEMQMSEEGAFINMTLLETLNAAVEQQAKDLAEAKQLVEQLTQQKADMSAEAEKAAEEHQKAIDELKADHAGDLAQAQAAHETAIGEKDQQIAALEKEKTDLSADLTAKAEQIETLTADLEGAKASLATAEKSLEEKDADIQQKGQQIEDLTAKVAELESKPGNQPNAGAAPVDNGKSPETQEVAVERYVFDKELSYEENCRLEEEWNKKHLQ